MIFFVGISIDCMTNKSNRPQLRIIFKSAVPVNKLDLSREKHSQSKKNPELYNPCLKMEIKTKIRLNYKKLISIFDLKIFL